MLNKYKNSKLKGRKQKVGFAIIASLKMEGKTITWLEHESNTKRSRISRQDVRQYAAANKFKHARSNRSCPNNKNQLSYYSRRAKHGPRKRDSHRYRPAYPVSSRLLY